MASAHAMSDGFYVRRPLPDEDDVLFDIWWQSARATHTFLREDQLRDLVPRVRQLRLASLDTWLLCRSAEGPVGFLVMDGPRVEGLFIAPQWIRRGGGSLLLQHARELRGRLVVDVNEQNEAAVGFYLASGFVVVGRSETDGAGLPFPVLHLSEAPAD